MIADEMPLRVTGERPGPLAPAGRTRNAMTVDVEDYFQVEAFKSIVRRADWETTPARVERSTDHVMQLFADARVHATFFVLGWVVERFPGLIRRIAAAGHEVASHGSEHERVDTLTPAAFAADIARAKTLIEDCAGTAVRGYRAPTFSIGPRNWWAYDVLEEEGYRYSSSLFPIAHDLYGAPDAPRAPFHPTGTAFLEIPLTTVRLMGRNLPSSGGGYFRLLPYAMSKWSLRRVNRREGRAGIFYCHPWEFDVAQPVFRNAAAKSRFRHYTNIHRMSHRVSRLLADFSWDRMDRVFLDGDSGQS